jgi:hypothetical protein
VTLRTSFGSVGTLDALHKKVVDRSAVVESARSRRWQSEIDS